MFFWKPYLVGLYVKMYKTKVATYAISSSISSNVWPAQWLRFHGDKSAKFDLILWLDTERRRLFFRHKTNKNVLRYSQLQEV